MKKKLTHNLLLKILSVIFAFVLWLMVVIINDPYKTVVISGVPITIINEEEITSQGIGQIYSVVSPQSGTVSVKVYGQRTKVDNLKASDISAVVDFGVVSSVGAAYINVTEPEGVTIMSRTPEMMKIDIEALEEKTFDVVLDVMGSTAEGYVINDVRISPNVTKITAPESFMQKIAKVGVRADVSGLSSDSQRDLGVVLYDSSGKIIDYSRNENVSLSIKRVQAYIETFMIKEVKFEIYASGNLPENYDLISLSYEPASIMVKGVKEDMNQLETIRVPAASNAVDLSKITESCDVEVNISAFLPKGVFLLNEEDNKAVVHIGVEKIIEKTFEVPVKDIQVLGSVEGMNVKFTDEEQTVYITVKGHETNIKNLTLKDVSPYINIAGNIEGSRNYNVRVRASADFKLVEEPVVNIIVEPVIEDTGGDTEGE